MKRFSFALRYFKYLLRAKTKHGVHSPFVFNLFTTVISKKEKAPAFHHIEKLRSILQTDNSILEVEDFGAGSVVFKTQHRSIKDIARHSAKSAKYGQLLYRLVNHFKPSTILELGTSLGISTLYLSQASMDSTVYTIEGSKTISQKAQAHFKKLRATNIKSITGKFEEVLATKLGGLGDIDFIFFDGNHRKAPTLNYFEQCLAVSTTSSVFVFDDIHWSDEMEDAWDLIKKHPQVTITIDLFFVGLVFFRKEQVKEHFVLRF